MTQSEITPNNEYLNQAMDVDFGKELDSTFANGSMSRGAVVKGIITKIDSENVHIDIGMKSEGRVSVREFMEFGKNEIKVKEGDTVDVFVENLDNRHGESQLSREKAKREEVLDDLEKAQATGEPVEGIIYGKVKGGFMVDVQGILGFMPGSQLDARPITDPMPYMHNTQELMIVKLDRKRNNLIVSRRAVQDQNNSGTRDELLSDMHEGKVLKGVVKNITDYGAFIDLGGIDGLLHITDISWQRITHPSEVLKVGETIEVQVTRFDADNQRVSLGMKQLSKDPWESVDDDYPLEKKVKGTVTNLTDYGAFVKLAPGVEGLIHVSEMSWTRKNTHPNKILNEGQDVEVMVLEIERDKRRISLGLKQCQSNPWESFAKDFKVGDKVKGSIRSTTDFGVFVGLTEDIDGLIHVSDLSWDQSAEDALASYRKGDEVEAIILALDPEKERIALGVKQLSNDPFQTIADTYKKGQVVKVKVTDTDDDGITVDFVGFECYIRKRDLGVDRDSQNPDKYKDGQEIDAKLTNISTKDRKIVLSVKALQIDEEKAAVAEYASDDDAGDSALAAALKQAGVAAAEAEAKAEEKPKKKAAPKAKKAEAKEDAAEEAKAEEK